jgi:hypothetical protein
MISLMGRRPLEPAEFQATVSVAQQAIQQIIDAGQTPRNEDFEDLWRRFKYLFAAAQHGECAYCESQVTAGYPGDVEHYRPKAEIRPARDRGNRDDTQGQPPGRRYGPIKRPGYWWLAYVWTNYLLTCLKCNNWKAHQFPLAGARAAAPGREANENPLLLNPFDQNPTGHLEFDEFGLVRGLTPQGIATIDVCGLDRRTLELHRAIKANKVVRRLEEYEGALLDGNELAQRNALRALLDECRDSEPYAGLARALTAAGTDLSYAELLQLEAQGVL